MTFNSLFQFLRRHEDLRGLQFCQAFLMTVKEGTGVCSSLRWLLAFISPADKPGVMTGEAFLVVLVNVLLSHMLGSAGTRTTKSLCVSSLCNSGDDDSKPFKSCMNHQHFAVF